MSVSTAGLSAWTDEHALELIHKSVVGATSVGYMKIQTGVKETATINILDTAVTFANDGCSRSATDSTPLTQRTLTVGDIAIHEDLCAKSLKGFYTQTMLGAGSLNGEDEIPFEQLYWEHKSSIIAETLEDALWSGDTTDTVANNNKFDGFLKIIDAASPVDGNADGVATATGIVKSNVISILWGVYQALPEAILKADDLICFMPLDKFRVLQQAIYEANLFHYTGEDAQSCEILLPGTGFKVVGVPGLSATNRIIAGRQSNFYVGQDLENESESFRSWYSDDDRVQKFTMAFKFGVQVAFPTEIVEFTLV